MPKADDAGADDENPWAGTARAVNDLEREIATAVQDRLQSHVASREARRRGRRKRRTLTPEEQAYADARRAANAKIGFLFHFIPYAATCLFLLLVAGFRAFLAVAIFWGIGVACHWFAMQAPGLRKRWIDAEVRKRLDRSVLEERQSMQSQHNRNLEELTASIAHEIRNPITAAKSLVQQMGEDPRSNENIEYAKVALDELDRVERSVSHLLKFAREEDVRMGDVSLADVVQTATDTFQDRVARSRVALTTEVDTDGVMRGDPEKLRRVVINLVSNSLDALEESGTLDPRIEVQTGENLAGSEVWLRIRDNGPGIDSEKLAQIFKPFFTSKRAGTGLGLAITKKLVDAHGGHIEASSRPGEGAEFVLTFPKLGGKAEARV